jgi:hypothetical protein
MDLSPYLETVRTGVANAASLADENTQQVAYRLGTAIESTTRLALIQALSDAAGTLSAELAPTSVELRMAGQDPEFVVNVPSAGAEPTLLIPESEPTMTEQGGPEDESDEPLARISLRLPASVKARVDEQANKDGISTNAWLVRAVLDALADRRPGPEGHPHPTPPPPHAGGIFGPDGPFGPHGVFGEHGPFGGVFGGKTHASQRAEHRYEQGHGAAGGSVQGWAQ